MSTQQDTLDFGRALDVMQQAAHGPRLGVIFKSTGTGEQLKQEGMEKVLAKRAAKIYKGHMEDALLNFKIGDVFTAETLRGLAGRPPEGVHYNSAGAIISGMAKRGLIERTNLKPAKSQRPIAHANLLPFWRLVRYAERLAA